jgi:hypothetical protein
MRNYFATFEDGTIYEIHNCVIEIKVNQQISTFTEARRNDVPHKCREGSELKEGITTYYLVFSDDLSGDDFQKFFVKPFRIGPLEFTLMSIWPSEKKNEAIGRLYAR